jgi:KUP system potassium uptake protein
MLTDRSYMQQKVDPRLAVAALGIVFGDIGTSPLYTLKACFDFSGASPTHVSDVLGIASLLIYALLIVVCVKYVGVIMRADHDGEGGILALLALGSAKAKRGFPVAGGTLLVIIVIGAAMLLGDGSLTPAISVVSAIEGLELISPSAAAWVVPVSIAILIGLFMVQSRGTEKIGRIFGPVMLVWFAAIGISGIYGIAQHPAIVAAFDPRHAVWFLLHHGAGGFFVLGGVVLAMTGVEALYADLSHFGRLPIAWAWYGVVFPTLILCYLGECAMTLVNIHALEQPWYALTPGIWRIPAILLATVATVSASQALISGAFTLIQQAIALGLSPRLEVRHTSANLRGQVYIPVVNFALMIGCVTLVLIFRSSTALSAAFGLAVSCTMLATSLAWYHVAVKRLGMKKSVAMPLVMLFILIDGSFVIAGLPKFMDGGWVPFAVSTILTMMALVWRGGRAAVAEALNRGHAPVEYVQEQLTEPVAADAATMVVLSSDSTRVPFYENHAWVRHLMHDEHLVLLTFIPEQIPVVAEVDKVQITQLGRIQKVEARFGYMEPARIRPIVDACRKAGLELDRDDVSYIIAEPRIRASDDKQNWLTRAQRTIFSAMTRVGRPLSEDLRIPAERQIEVGITVLL